MNVNELFTLLEELPEEERRFLNISDEYFSTMQKAVSSFINWLYVEDFKRMNEIESLAHKEKLSDSDELKLNGLLSSVFNKFKSTVISTHDDLVDTPEKFKEANEFRRYKSELPSMQDSLSDRLKVAKDKIDSFKNTIGSDLNTDLSVKYKDSRELMAHAYLNLRDLRIISEILESLSF
jgi:hypothetical protein